MTFSDIFQFYIPNVVEMGMQTAIYCSWVFCKVEFVDHGSGSIVIFDENSVLFNLKKMQTFNCQLYVACNWPYWCPSHKIPAVYVNIRLQILNEPFHLSFKLSYFIATNPMQQTLSHACDSVL